MIKNTEPTTTGRRISIFGLGYVGCVTAACLARNGHDVTGIDANPNKVEQFRSGISPVGEPGLEELLQQGIASGRLTATTEVREAVERSDMAILAVGSPSMPDGSLDASQVERVVVQILAALAPDKPFLIIVRSTILPGVLEERLRPLLDDHPQVDICNHPEFLREATAIRDFDHPPMIIVGGEPASCEQVLELYEDHTCPKIATDTRTAAMVKYTCNAFHALKIAFANEIGALSKAIGIDGREVMRIACLDNILNISTAYLKPGYAFGGSCLPKDVRALVRCAQLTATRAELLDGVLASNKTHLERAIQAVELSGQRQVGLVGLAFKAGTDDLRESPQVLLAEALLGKGYDLRIYDPTVRMKSLVGNNKRFAENHLPHLTRLLCSQPQELLDHSELLILGTDLANELELIRFSGEILDLRSDLVAYRPAVCEMAKG